MGTVCHLPTVWSWTGAIQGAFQLSLVEADTPTVPPQEATLVALVSSLLVVFTLAFLGLFFLYCKQFFNRHCQRVAGGLLQFEADKTAKEESLFPVPPSKETSAESQVSWAPGSLAQLFSLDSVPIPQQQQGPEM
ncbi:tumor necrosis factor receptor superfamily member 27 isoform 6 [Homo sapiens]|uniref:tumor necrosis factor receptor superfamily member 27 isoform 6 n=1 Tax=Homo sapiens TaxID=9606 RepID=UPI00110BF147|nr:tumor necrosis factor receptor superfamily member 27 isoform 6 [Homo sapiens]XP_047298283.1 tumor necrosis factor receptor superfamily member 27 isoform X30 [Homo sapiens]